MAFAVYAYSYFRHQRVLLQGFVCSLGCGLTVRSVAGIKAKASRCLM